MKNGYWTWNVNAQYKGALKEFMCVGGEVVQDVLDSCNTEDRLEVECLTPESRVP